MKYPHLNSLVPQGEHFDESAINEGVYLSVEHVNAIEQKIGENAGLSATIKENATALQTANSTIAIHEATIETMGTKATEDAATIANLQAEVKKLGKESSGPGSTLKVTAAAETTEETPSGNGKPKFDSADHPANKFADSQKKYDSGIPAKK